MTLADAQANYTAASEAYRSALSGKSYSIGSGGNSRSFTRHDIDKLRSEMNYWAATVRQLENNQNGIRFKLGLPV